MSGVPGTPFGGEVHTVLAGPGLREEAGGGWGPTRAEWGGKDGGATLGTTANGGAVVPSGHSRARPAGHHLSNPPTRLPTLPRKSLCGRVGESSWRTIPRRPFDRRGTSVQRGRHLHRRVEGRWALLRQLLRSPTPSQGGRMTFRRCLDGRGGGEQCCCYLVPHGAPGFSPPVSGFGHTPGFFLRG